MPDFHVTLLHLLGLDDARLRYFHQGREKQLQPVRRSRHQGIARLTPRRCGRSEDAETKGQENESVTSIAYSRGRRNPGTLLDKNRRVERRTLLSGSTRDANRLVRGWRRASCIHPQLFGTNRSLRFLTFLLSGYGETPESGECTQWTSGCAIPAGLLDEPSILPFFEPSNVARLF